jgi:hypothetical protein
VQNFGDVLGNVAGDEDKNSFVNHRFNGDWVVVA